MMRIFIKRTPLILYKRALCPFGVKYRLIIVVESTFRRLSLLSDPPTWDTTRLLWNTQDLLELDSWCLTHPPLGCDCWTFPLSLGPILRHCRWCHIHLSLIQPEEFHILQPFVQKFITNILSIFISYFVPVKQIYKYN